MIISLMELHKTSLVVKEEAAALPERFVMALIFRLLLMVIAIGWCYMF